MNSRRFSLLLVLHAMVLMSFTAWDVSKMNVAAYEDSQRSAIYTLQACAQHREIITVGIVAADVPAPPKVQEQELVTFGPSIAIHGKLVPLPPLPVGPLGGTLIEGAVR